MALHAEMRSTQRAALTLNGGRATPLIAKGAPGADGSNVLPTDTAIANAMNTVGSLTDVALSASIEATGAEMFIKGTVLVGPGIDLTGTTDSTVAVLAKAAVAATTPDRRLVNPGGTIRVSGTIVLDHGMTLSSIGPAGIFKATDTADYEYMVRATGKTNVTIENVTLDGNMAARIAAGVVNRCVGIYLDTCTDSQVRNVVVTGAFGQAGNGSAAVAIGGGIRNRIDSCSAVNCGTAGHASDGFYTSGVQNLITSSAATNCLDTGFVIESSNESGIIGCTSVGCSAGGAITNALNTDVRGNFIDGLTVYDFDAVVTGGVQIGNPLSSSTGNLLNTLVSNVLIERVAGGGPAINVRQTGTAITKGLTISNVRIKGASTQGMLIVAQNVIVSDCSVEGTTDACIEVDPGSDTVLIQGCHLRFTNTFGIAVVGSADNVTITNNYIDGLSTGNHGVYWFNTCANAVAFGNTVVNYDVAAYGSDAGTTPRIVWPHPSGSGLLFGKAAAAGIYALSNGQVASDAGYHTAGPFTHAGSSLGFFSAAATTQKTGWGSPTGTATRTTFATGSVTLPQLAERVRGLVDDLKAYGLLGP